MNRYQPVIGLEIHVELKTKSKMFCQCAADYFGKEPNTNTCPVCLGLPGGLPVPNKKAIEWTVLIGKALDCSINRISKFDRKHYFYPDLPKGYQISQYDEPIAVNGKLSIFNLQFSIKSQSPNLNNKTGNTKTFRIHRVHLEEDTGKLLHEGDDTLVDFNRSGVPLVEIVTEPDFDNSDDVKQFLEELHTIIRYLGVSDADMEKGSMRLEPNISIRVLRHSGDSVLRKSPESQRDPGLSQDDELSPQDDKLPPYKVEVKNINSFRFVKQAIEYEVERQTEILEEGKIPEQETRGFDSKKQVTYSQRSKEEAHDYRYFPEPDIPPLTFSKEYIDSISIPELPQEKVEKYVKNYKLKYQDAFQLTRDIATSVFFEKVISKLQNPNHKQFPNFKFQTDKTPQTIANLIINKRLSTNIVEEFISKSIELLSPKETDTDTLSTVIDKIITVNQKVVEDYKKGKQNAIMFLVGQVMREMKGKAEAKLVIEELKKHLQ